MTPETPADALQDARYVLAHERMSVDQHRLRALLAVLVAELDSERICPRCMLRVDATFVPGEF